MKRQNLMITAVVALVILLVAVALLFFIRSNKDSRVELPRGLAREFSFAKVQENNTKSSCWVSFGAQVFDITRLLTTLEQNQSEELALLCGTNIDTLPSAIKTKEKLYQYQIGILVP